MNENTTDNVALDPTQLNGMVRAIEQNQMTPTEGSEFDDFVTVISRIEDAIVNDIPFVQMGKSETKVIMSRIGQIRRNHPPTQWMRAIFAANNSQAFGRGYRISPN